ncbi:MAG TPA: DUF3465 domain-containing protein [Candidatus Eremiobacteraceae bacterium]|nr:DUF3465 domain-containing protein [Candidatus Eremiobacteraceae bacterium]
MSDRPGFVPVAGALAAAVLAACAAADKPDDAAALRDIASGQSGREVIVEGTTTAVFPTVTGASGAHEEFELRIGTGSAVQSILVADNVTIGEVAPVKNGDDVIVKGVLELDPGGPVIHWTHHDPEFRHAPGFVEVGGKIYD